MKYNKIRICCKISLLTSKKAVHINKPLSPQKTSENLWFSNYFFLGGNRLSNWFKFVWYKKQNLAKSILSSQSQYDQSIWLTKLIWSVTFKATCVSPLIFKIISARWRHLVLRNVTWGKCTTSWKGYLWSYTTTMLIIICCWCDRKHLGVGWKCRTVLVLN